MAEFINASDSLNDGRKKLNKSIEQSERAENKSDKAIKDSSEAKRVSEESNEKSDYTQTQLDTVIGASTIDPAVEQLKVGSDGQVYPSPDARIRTEHEKVAAQFDQTNHKLTLEGWELNSKGRKKDAFTVFRSDDGRHEEFTHALPLFNAKGVPQNIAIVSDWVNSSGFVSKDELLELQNEHDWEILSHSKTHPTRSGGGTMIPDLPESEARYELKQSRDDLLKLGLDVESYAVVGGQYNTRDRQLFREYYRSALTSAPGRYRGLNQTPITSHDMYTHWIDPTAGDLMEFLKTDSKEVAIQKTLQNAYEAIDYASENGGILIFGTHFMNIARDDDYMQMYSDLIDYAKLKTKVTTLSDALNNYGNIIEIGDNASLTSNQMSERRAHTNHLAIGIDGKMSGGNLMELDEYTGKTDWREFPLGITTTPISGAVAIESGLPEGAAGTLTNYKLVPTPLQTASYNYQIYRVSRSKREYHRQLGGNLNFLPWFLNSAGIVLHEEQDNSLTKGVKEYPPGITYSNISSSHPDINLAPDEKSGLLITQVTNNGSAGYNPQIYITTFETNPRVFFRRPLNDTEWTEWKDLNNNNVFDVEKNSSNISTPISTFPVGITYSLVSEGTPSEKTGTLVTHKVIASGSVGRNYQEFHEFQTGDIYKRVPTGNDTWGGWRKILME